MPAGHVPRAPLDHVGDESHRRVDREAPFLLRDVLLEDVGLDRPPEPLRGDALPLGRDDVEGEHDRRRRVDRHRHGDLVERDPTEQGLHVQHGVDRDALAADLTQGSGVIRVVPHQARHVEGRGQSRLAVVEQVTEALVRLLCGPEPGELAHRPQPPAVHRAVDAPRERELTRDADRLVRVSRQVAVGVQRLDRLAGQGRERRLALGRQPVRLAPLLVAHWDAAQRTHRKADTSMTDNRKSKLSPV